MEPKTHPESYGVMGNWLQHIGSQDPFGSPKAWALMAYMIITTTLKQAPYITPNPLKGSSA